MIVTSGQLGIALSSNQPAYVKTIFSVTGIVYIYISCPQAKLDALTRSCETLSPTLPRGAFLHASLSLSRGRDASSPLRGLHLETVSHDSPRYFPVVNTVEEEEVKVRF